MSICMLGQRSYHPSCQKASWNRPMDPAQASGIYRSRVSVLEILMEFLRELIPAPPPVHLSIFEGNRTTRCSPYHQLSTHFLPAKSIFNSRLSIFSTQAFGLPICLIIAFIPRLGAIPSLPRRFVKQSILRRRPEYRSRVKPQITIPLRALFGVEGALGAGIASVSVFSISVLAYLLS
ncbi:putative O-acetyltransferase SAT14 [Fusarium oxysporum f. sp. albedinis]|nr:putative O-acetyltransferase SAT14 [Fusarium oxysporum f. sp. albedinis]